MFSVVSWVFYGLGYIGIFALIAVPDSQATIHNCSYSFAFGGKYSATWQCMSEGWHYASTISLIFLLYINMFSKKFNLDRDEELNLKFATDIMLAMAVMARIWYLYKNHANYIYGLWTILIFIICVVRFYELHKKVHLWIKKRL